MYWTSNEPVFNETDNLLIEFSELKHNSINLITQPLIIIYYNEVNKWTSKLQETF